MVKGEGVCVFQCTKCLNVSCKPSPTVVLYFGLDMGVRARGGGVPRNSGNCGGKRQLGCSVHMLHMILTLES